MRERQRGRVVDVLAARRDVPPVSGQGASGVVDHDVGAMPEDIGFHADRRDEPRLAGADADVLDRGDRLAQST